MESDNMIKEAREWLETLKNGKFSNKHEYDKLNHLQSLDFSTMRIPHAIICSYNTCGNLS